MNNRTPRAPLRAGLGVALVLLVLLGLNVVQVVRGCDELRPMSKGMRARPFSLKTLSGEVVTLQDLRGRGALISFWATWCRPCIKELPILAKLQQEQGDRGIRILAINTEVDPEKVRAFIKDAGLSELTILLDDGQTAARYGVHTLPHLVLIDEAGLVQGVHSGAANEQEIRRWVE